MFFNPVTLLVTVFAAISYVSAGTIEDTIIKSSLPWKSLPATPKLPEPSKGKYARVNGIKVR
jgi:hypothetical protein